MRATLARSVALAIAVVVVAGCRSTGNSGWSNWGKKGGATTAGGRTPALPSAALPPGQPPASHTATAPVMSPGYAADPNATVGAGTASPYSAAPGNTASPYAPPGGAAAGGSAYAATTPQNPAA